MTKRIYFLLCAIVVASPSWAQDPLIHWRTTPGPMQELEKKWLTADEDDREKISKMAYGELEKQFEDDMERRREELEKVEERIDRLRNQLSKRADKKDDIIDLQLKQVTMTWEGLGWTPPPNEHPSEGLAVLTKNSNRFRQAMGRLNYFPPKPPKPPGFTFEFGGKSSSDRKPVEEIIKAAVRGDEDKLQALAKKLVKTAKGADPIAANDMVWSVFTEVGDQVEDKSFWKSLAESAYEASERIDDDPESLGNVLDTAAHCYNLAGKRQKALKIQMRAVDASAEARDGEPNDELAEFLVELGGELKDYGSDDDSDDEDSEDSE